MHKVKKKKVLISTVKWYLFLPDREKRELRKHEQTVKISTNLSNSERLAVTLG